MSVKPLQCRLGAGLACVASQAFSACCFSAPCVTHLFKNLQLLSGLSVAFHSSSRWASHTAFPCCKCRGAAIRGSVCPQTH